MAMEIIRMAMATGMAGLMGDLVMAAGGVSEAWSAKYKRSIDCDNQKDSPKEHTVGVARR